MYVCLHRYRYVRAEARAFGQAFVHTSTPARTHTTLDPHAHTPYSVHHIGSRRHATLLEGGAEVEYRCVLIKNVIKHQFYKRLINPGGKSTHEWAISPNGRSLHS